MATKTALQHLLDATVKCDEDGNALCLNCEGEMSEREWDPDEGVPVAAILFCSGECEQEWRDDVNHGA